MMHGNSTKRMHIRGYDMALPRGTVMGDNWGRNDGLMRLSMGLRSANVVHWGVVEALEWL